jgi:hypothetical protein
MESVKEIISKILELNNIDARLDEQKEHLYLSGIESFVGVTIDKIKIAEEKEGYFTLRTSNVWITVYKTVRSIHISVMM